MATNTTNYNLVKPDQTDFYDVGDFNGNADIIDAQLKSINDQYTNLSGAVETNTVKVDAALAMGVRTLSCTKSGKTFKLAQPLPSTGLYSCIFTAPADYMTGDSFTVNGAVYAVSTSDGEELPDKAFVSGAVVPMVLDQTGKTINFKQAGRKLTLSAESYLMVNCFTANGAFTAPMTGKYRVTCIGKGGAGANAAKAGTGDFEYKGINGPGGGAGGAGQVVVTLEKGSTVAVTASGTASFGSYLTAAAGSDGKVQQSGSTYTAVPGVSGDCSGAGATVFPRTNATAGTNKVISDNGTATGGNGGAYPASASRFLSTEGGIGADVTVKMDAMPPVKPSASGLAPFGAGGGGGGYRCYYTAVTSTVLAYLPEFGKGSPGGQAVVIIELVN